MDNTVSDDELDEVKWDVLTREGTEFMSFFAKKCYPWKVYVKRYHSREYDRACSEWMSVVSDPNLLNLKIKEYI